MRSPLPNVASCAAFALLISSSAVTSSSSFSVPARIGLGRRPTSAAWSSSSSLDGGVLTSAGRGWDAARWTTADPPLPVFVAIPRGGSSHDGDGGEGEGSGAAEAMIPNDDVVAIVAPRASAAHVDHSPVHTARQIRHELASSSSSSSSSSSLPRLGPNAPPPGPIRRLLPSFPWHSLPNYLTYARCLSIPIFLLLSYYPDNFVHRAPVLSVIFALASITDWLDGYLARRWDVTSPFGAFLDPVADKLMVSTALIVLSGRYGGIVAIPSSIIMAREVGVSALREWMAQRGKRESVGVGMQGKVKAALTMVSLSLMLLVPGGIELDTVGWTRHLGSSLLGSGGGWRCGLCRGDCHRRRRRRDRRECRPVLFARSEPDHAIRECGHHGNERKRLFPCGAARAPGE
jgi:CDP-diacylglycerol--glycerol-3-phosphate 3-phosphatidyltransferase